MITKQQAIECSEFHANGCTLKHIERWRRNGQTKTWKLSPDRFRVPVKHGLYAYSAITEQDAHLVHAAEDCPLRNG